jgi:hypothetical protein
MNNHEKQVDELVKGHEKFCMENETQRKKINKYRNTGKPLNP